MGYTPHVLVIGGGVTGITTARDLAIRGLDVTLVERGTLASGATGWTETLLESGARHAATDPELARRCLREGQVLREIAGHCIDDSGGLLVDHGDQSAQYDRTIEACRELDISVRELGADEIRAVEPSLSPEIDRAARIPDATVDPFRLALDTASDAAAHGATIRTHTEVTDVLVEDGSVVGVRVDGTRQAVTDGGAVSPAAAPGRSFGAPDTSKQRPGESGSQRSGDGNRAGQSERGDTLDHTSIENTVASNEEEIRADYVVNAAGAHAGEIASMAGFDLPLEFTRSAVVLSASASTETIVRQIQESGEQHVVPAGSMSVLGTATETVENPDDETGLSEAVDGILAGLSETVPGIETTRLPRTEWSVRTDLETADISGGVHIDHTKYHDTWGMVTVVGARLTTHRHLAERVTDHICGEFGIQRECQTDELSLRNWGGTQNAFGRLTDDTDQFERGQPDPQGAVICPCLGVTKDAVHEAIDDAGPSADLNDVRIRTGAGSGVCQGGRCAHRMATQLHPGKDRYAVESALNSLLNERWRGQRYTLWGDQLTSAMETYLLHTETTDRMAPDASSLDLSRFSDGSETTDERPTQCLREPP
ncbi:FAD-dependent oxidoreductase [Halovenus marina]|uniref:FAD-dependent oxidoreductase n=1 Tax=Halovenus marina TaxID=3396621 RepID=UPI003F55FA4B